MAVSSLQGVKALFHIETRKEICMKGVNAVSVLDLIAVIGFTVTVFGLGYMIGKRK